MHFSINSTKISLEVAINYYFSYFSQDFFSGSPTRILSRNPFLGTTTPIPQRFFQNILQALVNNSTHCLNNFFHIFFQTPSGIATSFRSQASALCRNSFSTLRNSFRDFYRYSSKDSFKNATLRSTEISTRVPSGIVGVSLNVPS